MSATRPRGVRPARSGVYPWYDSVWLAKYSEAKEIIRAARPHEFDAFVDRFRILHTRPDFEPIILDGVFEPHELAELRQLAGSLLPSQLELHEAPRFRRFLVSKHEVFDRLQQRAVTLVGEAVGEEVEASYNSLSLYTRQGVCPLHMDAPNAKWTLDLCLEQTVPWPIYFSQVQAWPEKEEQAWSDPRWEERLKRSLPFERYELREGQAIVFSGSSQWHYRDPMPAGAAHDRATLLFLHFIPKGTVELLDPAQWARLFGIAELAHLSLPQTVIIRL